MKKLLLTTLLLVSFQTMANFSLNNIDKSDLDGISKEFSANFMHTSVSPASSLGEIWGVEVGVIGGVTDSPKLAKLVKEQDSSENIDKLPHLGALGVVSIPFGITGELAMIPKQSSSNYEIKTTSYALKWTISEILPIPFVDLAVKVHHSSAEFKYTDTISSVKTTVTLDQSVTGAHIVASTDALMVIEPYVGLGFARGSTDLGATGNISIFDTTFTTSQSQSSSNTSSHIFAGVQLNLFILHVAAEYSRAFETNKYTGKVSLYF